MNSSKYLALSIVISLAMPTAQASQAQTDLFDLTLEQLLKLKVVSAVTGVEQDLNSAPASVTIIEAQEWQRRGAKTLSQALTGVAGVQSTVLSSSNAERNYVFRGLTGSFGQQVKLLINGIPFNRIHHGGKPALDIPLGGFKRIEIVRSPGSATYGADAFAGIINLVANDDVNQGSKLSLSAGSFDDYDVTVSGAKNWQQLALTYAFNYNKYGDDPKRLIQADTQTLFDGIFNTDASRAPGRFDQSYQQASLQLNARWQDWAVSYYGLTGEFGFGAGVAEALDPEGQGKHHSHVVDIKYDMQLFDADKTVFNLWWQDKHSKFPFTIFPAGARLPIGQDGNLDFANPSALVTFKQGYIGVPSNDSTLAQMTLTSVLAAGQGHQLRWQLGVEYHKHTPSEWKNFGPGVLSATEQEVSGELTNVSATPYAYLPERSRNIQFLSFNDTWQIQQDWSLHLGGRYDHYSDFGSTFNPRLGLVWQATDKVSVKLLSARAYRAPSFYDLYAVNNPVNLGNPELKPERVTTNELNLGWSATDNLAFDMSYYRYRASDIIQYIAVPGMTGKKAHNQGEIEGQGIEWTMQWRASAQLNVSTSLSYVDNEDGNGQTLAGFADKMASVEVNYKHSTASQFNLFWLYTGQQARALGDSRPALASANWLTARYSYQVLPQQLELALVINNLLDQDAATPSNAIAQDYPIAGRQWQLELHYQF